MDADAAAPITTVHISNKLTIESSDSVRFPAEAAPKSFLAHAIGTLLSSIVYVLFVYAVRSSMLHFEHYTTVMFPWPAFAVVASVGMDARSCGCNSLAARHEACGLDSCHRRVLWTTCINTLDIGARAVLYHCAYHHVRLLWLAVRVATPDVRLCEQSPR